ncbi:GntR family transcriptional regulator [Bradyrhizobium sp. JR3.5]
MSQIQTQPTLVEQVVNAIVSEIVDGELPANSRLIQDELARAYGVSRQPVQQALLLLRDRGMVKEARRTRPDRCPTRRRLCPKPL